MKKLLTLLFAVALTLSMSSFTLAQDAGTAGSTDTSKKDMSKDKKTKSAKKDKKSKKDDSTKKDDMSKPQ